MANSRSNRYHAAGTLDVLQLTTDDDERHGGFRNLLGSEDEKLTGLMLFKYHTMGNTLAPSNASDNCPISISTEAAANDVFSRLNEEQRQFWATATVKLAEGDCTPLGSQTLASFLASHPEADLSERNGKTNCLLIDLDTPETPAINQAKSVLITPPKTDSSQSSFDLDANSPATDPPSPLSHRQLAKSLGLHRHAFRTKLVIDSQDKQEMEKYPILRLICQGSPSKLWNEQIIDKILKFLGQRIHDNPESHLTGRYQGMQLNYDPGATNVRGIKARLDASLTRKVFVDEADLPVKDTFAEFEALLRPFVAWNREFWTMSEFATMTMPGEHDGRTYTTDYASCIDWFLRTSTHLLPVSQTNKDEVVQSIMDFLREKASLHSSHPLVKYGTSDLPRLAKSSSRKDNLLHDSVKRFSLKDIKTGFGTELLSCFELHDLSSEEYLDFLEQKLYLLQREFPALKLMEDEVQAWT